MRKAWIIVVSLLAGCSETQEPTQGAPSPSTPPSSSAAATATASASSTAVPAASSDVSDGAAPGPSDASVPAGRVLIGNAGVLGGTIANVSGTVAGLRSPWSDCYRRSLQQDPQMRGSVVLVLKVGADGSVTEVGGGGSAALSAIVGCLKQVASKAKFSPPQGGSAIVSVPITFEHD